MASTSYERLIIGDLRRGRNGTDPPFSLQDQECVEALNVDYYNATLARKRGGADALSLTFSAGGPFTGSISFLGRHVPTASETGAELWAIDDAATPVVGRLAGATTWTAPTLKDNLTGNAWDVTAVTLNGHYFLAYASAVDRLHVWDGSTVRRTGLAVAQAPTVANQGAGAYAATQRWYRIRWTVQSGGVTVRRSDVGTSVAFTPSGAGAAARVTIPAVANEGETHWELEASADNVLFYVIATTAIGTTFYDDSNTVDTYSTFNASPSAGTYTVQKSYKYLAVDGNRLLGFGSWGANDKQNRIEFSAVIGADVGDEERIPLNNYIDLDESDSGSATGLVGPVMGAFYAFKARQIWKLVPTGVSTSPYSVFPISKVIGALSHQSIKVAEDDGGNPSIYFMSVRGPYRLGGRGLEYLGLGVEDLILGPTHTINLNPSHVVAHTVYHVDKKQVWFWFASDGSGDPNVKIVWDVKRAAWTRHSGVTAAMRCSVMFANTVGALMSSDLKPYVGGQAANKILKCDTSATSDDGTTFQAYILTKPYMLAGIGTYATVGQGTLVAQAAAGVTITQTLIRDLGLESTVATVSIAPQASETRIQRLIDSGHMGSCWAIQVQLGDGAAIANAWTLDALQFQYRKDQDFA